MLIRTNRFTLRDFREEDRTAFVSYQRDPRYRGLYDANDGEEGAQALFDLFLAWRQVSPRENYQLGIFEAEAGRLWVRRATPGGRATWNGRPRD